MSAVDTKWAERIRAGDRRVLINQFRHEASELRRIMMERPHGFHSPWRDFRNFLADVGPSPGPAYHIVPRRPGPYGPNNAGWESRSSRDHAASIEASSTYSQWTVVSGAPVQYGELAKRHGVSFAGLSSAAAAGLNMTQVVERAAAADGDTTDLSWFSPNEAHQEAFRQAYKSWKIRVLPRYGAAATPKFLYLYTLIPTMARCKATLIEAGLWKPLTRATLEKRDSSQAWKRFNELLPKAAMTVAEFEIYRQYSLTEHVEELSERLQAAELRFRTGVTKPPARAA